MKYDPTALKFVRLFIKLAFVICGFSAVITLTMLLLSIKPLSEQWPFILGSMAMYAAGFAFLRFLLYIFSESK
jgi:hypothetical protein